MKCRMKHQTRNKIKQRINRRNTAPPPRLQAALQQQPHPEKLEETIELCTLLLQDYPCRRMQRTTFWGYLADVLRFEGAGIFGLQTAILLVVCIVSETVVKEPRYIPAFMPLFGLALMPVLFRSQFCGMGELEAVTRASGAQIILAKLVLAGAADLVCITALLCLQMRLQDSRENMGQMVLYCLVPYLVCLTAMLRLLRLRRRESIPVCGIAVLGSGFGWGMSAVLLPELYETSAAGIWLLAFLLFAGFFSKEIYYIIETRREGKMYGIIG